MKRVFTELERAQNSIDQLIPRYYSPEGLDKSIQPTVPLLSANKVRLAAAYFEFMTRPRCGLAFSSTISNQALKLEICFPLMYAKQNKIKSR